MISPYGLALDLLAYQVHGKIRSTLLSSREIVTPVAGTITNTQRVLQPSETISIPLTGILSALAIKSSGTVSIHITIDRNNVDVVLPELVSTGLTVLTDTVKTLSITNTSAVPVDASIVSI